MNDISVAKDIPALPPEVAGNGLRIRDFYPFHKAVAESLHWLKGKFSGLDERMDRQSQRASQLERRLKKTERLYLGAWKEDKIYRDGDLATRDGSLWHCQVEATMEPPKGSSHWQLAVKRGGNGKDGERGPVGPMPKHRWVDQTKLQFQQGPDGSTWSPPVELRGPEGAPGRAVPVMGGGGATVNTNSWAPAGW